MEKTIWKFELQLAALTMIKIPKYSEILSIQSQRDEVCLWALVDPKSETEERNYELFNDSKFNNGGNKCFIRSIKL